MSGSWLKVSDSASRRHRQRMNSAPIITESNRGSCTDLDVPGPRITGGSDALGDLSVPLVVQSACPTSAQQPVTVGVPFPRGVLRDDAFLSLLASSGKPVSLQLYPLARWPDGSVKWMLLDFILGPVVAGQSVWSLQLRQARRMRRAASVNLSAWRKQIELSSSRPGQPSLRSIARFLHHWPRLRSRIRRYWMRETHERCWSTQRVVAAILRSSDMNSKRTVPCGPRCCSKGPLRGVVIIATVFGLDSPSSQACPWSVSSSLCIIPGGPATAAVCGTWATRVLSSSAISRSSSRWLVLGQGKSNGRRTWTTASSPRSASDLRSIKTPVAGRTGKAQTT